MPAPQGGRHTAVLRRQQVIAVALREYARHGPRKARIQLICATTGISQAYLFRLFPSKHALFAAVLEHCFDLLESAFDERKNLETALGPVLRRDEGAVARLILQGWTAACAEEELAALCRKRLRLLSAQAGASAEEEIGTLAHGLLRVLAETLFPTGRISPAE